MDIAFLRFTSPAQAEEEMLAIGVHPAGAKIMAKKAVFITLKLSQVKAKVANIMKQDMISVGGDAAVHMRSVSCEIDTTDVLLLGTLRQLEDFLLKIQRQPWGMKEIAAEIRLQINEKLK